MSYLLDTHVFLWALSNPDRIRSKIRDLIVNPLYSAISAVEISIKQTLGKLQAPNNLEQEIEKRGFRTLPLEYRHGARLRHLPIHHQDPFDRLLLAQALEESLTLITHDKKLTSYSAKILLT
ncbi:MAG: type II toxin-antitoxin system VapC family toxin [Proteobacteria bacterium]|nr:type II toxin-antitoxin system VapC family toxin [Pseudomonadota bacterium]